MGEKALEKLSRIEMELADLGRNLNGIAEEFIPGLRESLITLHRDKLAKLLPQDFNFEEAGAWAGAGEAVPKVTSVGKTVAGRSAVLEVVSSLNDVGNKIRADIIFMKTIVDCLSGSIQI